MLEPGLFKRRKPLHQDKQNAVCVVAAVFYQPGEVLIFRRGPGLSGAGCWEFPGGKVEPGEDFVNALHREILEEIGVHMQIEEKIGDNIHQYPEKKIHLHFYWSPIPKEPFRLTDHDAFQSVKPQDLDLGLLSEADRAVVEIIKKDRRMKI
ncbi:MAG TPA: (deoxy)nucleoside triphosphate pyrophosphohydrolase [Pseudobdellovibrionaceae bacterium]|jgi:mutator protein MutT